MKSVENKKELVKQLSFLNDEIINMPLGASRATLDHKVKKRQNLIIELIERFKLELNEQDMALLESIKEHCSQLLKEVEKEKDSRVKEIIKSKSSKTRINLYSTIAKHK